MAYDETQSKFMRTVTITITKHIYSILLTSAPNFHVKCAINTPTAINMSAITGNAINTASERREMKLCGYQLCKMARTDRAIHSLIHFCTTSA